MPQRLKHRRMLARLRAGPRVDGDAGIPLVARLCQPGADPRKPGAALDANPLICSGNRIVALDAPIVRPA